MYPRKIIIKHALFALAGLAFSSATLAKGSYVVVALRNPRGMPSGLLANLTRLTGSIDCASRTFPLLASDFNLVTSRARLPVESAERCTVTITAMELQPTVGRPVVYVATDKPFVVSLSDSSSVQPMQSLEDAAVSFERVSGNAMFPEQLWFASRMFQYSRVVGIDMTRNLAIKNV